MLKYNEEKCRAELEEMGIVVTSFDITKKEENKIIADMSYLDENDATRLAFFKIYNTKKFEQIERVYTILQLLKTKLEAEAKKNNESFVNLLPEIYKIWKKGDFFYILEEKIEGASLADWAREKKIKTFDDFAKITKQICDAVAMIHQPFPPIVHCDIKETNIIIDKNDEVAKIIDFDAAFIEGSSAYNIVRSTRGYRPTEMVNDAPVSQSDIYAIGCILENIFKNSDWKNRLDSKCNDKLNQIIVKSKEELSRRYEKVNELKDVLSEVEILYMLQSQMNKLDIKDSFNVYSYSNDSNDRESKIDEVKKDLSNYPDSDILYVAKRQGQKLAFTMMHMYQIDDTDKKTKISSIPYDKLIACVKSNEQVEGIQCLDCIIRESAGQWKTEKIYLPSDATEIICDVLNNIVLFRNSYYSKERIAEYYSNKCHEVADILTRKELDGKRVELKVWWELIISLGTLACEKEVQCGKSNTACSCNGILKKVYDNKCSSLRNKLKENNLYSDQELINDIIECYQKEIVLGYQEVEEVLNEFENKVKEKQQLESIDKDKTSKIFGDIVNRFVAKKEEE